jgi:hypothetical protein
MGAFLLLDLLGAVLVIAACIVARTGRWVLLLAMAGAVTVGAGGLADGMWPCTASTWAVGAYLAVQWVRLERKARRR